MEIRKPAMAQFLVEAAPFKYLLVLKNEKLFYDAFALAMIVSPGDGRTELAEVGQDELFEVSPFLLL